ncbi:ankyrin repeat-containing domain protein [Nemania sp. FL0916]|nr:ankyrin repeat-containing domain protein [Nemania sp. FL0916]
MFNINASDPLTGISPLIEATLAGHAVLVERLLDLGADVDMRENRGAREMAVHKAAQLGYAAIAKILIKKSPMWTPRNMQNESPLHLAARSGHVETIVALLPSTDDEELTSPEEDLVKSIVDVWTKFKVTPLHEACANGHLEAARLLLERGAEPDIEANYIGTPLHVAMNRGHIAIAALVLEHMDEGRSVTSEYGATLLHIAATGGHLDLVQKILSKWPTLYQVRDRYGWLPLDWARRNNHGEVMRILEDAAAADMFTSQGEEEHTARPALKQLFC